MHPDPTPPPPLPARDPSGHKGTFGTVTVFGGCSEAEAVMLGAPALVALAALRSGCGLARIAAPRRVLESALVICPSATGVTIESDGSGAPDVQRAVHAVDRAAEQSEALVVGPGLGGGAGVQPIVLRAVGQQEAPVVVDADALNALARVPELARDFRAAAVLTPHPGEFRRLGSALSISGDPTAEGDRPRVASELAQRLGCVVVLKGARTVVSDGQRVWTSDASDPALATAGTGDVLSGLIAGLIAQFVRLAAHPLLRAAGGLDLYDAARVGVAVHAEAARAWREGRGASAGLLAAELAEALPGALESRRG